MRGGGRTAFARQVPKRLLLCSGVFVTSLGYVLIEWPDPGGGVIWVLSVWAGAVCLALSIPSCVLLLLYCCDDEP